MKILAASFIFLIPCAASAMESHTVYNAQGEAVFKVRFIEVADEMLADANHSAVETTPGSMLPTADLNSTWDLDTRQKQNVLAAMDYWAEIIDPQPGQLPAIINISTWDGMNLIGISGLTGDESYKPTKVQAALSGKNPGSLNGGAHGLINIGKLPYDDIPYVPSQLSRAEHSVDLAALIVHEFAHNLGLSSDQVPSLNDDGTISAIRFPAPKPTL